MNEKWNATGNTGPAGLQGSQGPIGVTGVTGVTGIAGTSVGYAEYVFNSTTQAPNNSVPPYDGVSNFTAFTIPTQVYNSIPGSISALTIAPGSSTQGTFFTLQAGTYVIDYETTLTSNGSMAVYVGTSNLLLAVDTNTISGSTTGTTWIHGRNIQEVSTFLVFAVSPTVAPGAVPFAGNSTQYIIRLTILKIA